MAQKSWEIEEILPISKESKTIDCLMETRTQFSSFQQSKSMVLFTEYPCLPRAINHLYRHIITGEPGRKRKEYCAEPKRQSLIQSRYSPAVRTASLVSDAERQKTTRTYSYPRMAMEGTPNKYTIGFQRNASLKSPLSVAATARPEPQPGQYNPVRS